MDVKQLYYRIIVVANFFLGNASHLTVRELQEYDPTVAQIAKDMRTLATILKGLAGDTYEDENMAINALQCCRIMERIADVVASGNEGELEALVKNLELHTNVP
jgi:hypothetical protein